MSRLIIILILASLFAQGQTEQNKYSAKYRKPTAEVEAIAKKLAQEWLSNCGKSLNLPKNLVPAKLQFYASEDTWKLMDSLSKRASNMSDRELSYATTMVEKSVLYRSRIVIKKPGCRNFIDFSFNGMGTLYNVNVFRNCDDEDGEVNDFYKADCNKQN